MAKATELTEGQILDEFFAEEKTLRSDYVAPKAADPAPEAAALQDGGAGEKPADVPEASEAAEPGTGEATGDADKAGDKPATAKRTTAAARK